MASSHRTVTNVRVFIIFIILTLILYIYSLHVFHMGSSSPMMETTNYQILTPIYKNDTQRLQSLLYNISLLESENKYLSISLKNVTHLLSQKVSITNDEESESMKVMDMKRKDYDSDYLLSYDNWIRGIGDNYLWNNETGSNCIYPSIPYKMKRSQTFNKDILYKEKHRCSQNQFSSIYERIVTVHCVYAQNIVYKEFTDIFHGDLKAEKKMVNNWNIIHSNQTRENNNKYIINLKNKTQTIWIKCHNFYDHHIALLPLSTRNNSLYLEKTRKIKNNFKNKIPPNIVMLILDSTSRSNFFRLSPKSVNYLSELQINRNNDSTSNVFEFFRYSTVGWGTANNLEAVTAGKCPHCTYTKNKKYKENCVGLASYYDNMGYYVLGLDDFRNTNISKPSWQTESECDYYLSINVLPQRCSEGHRYDVDLAKIIALQSINELQRKSDENVPYLLMLHAQANHVEDGALMSQIDDYVEELVEYINKDNTIIHLISDHGSFMGNSLTNLYGQIDTKNPLSIILIPKHILTNKYFNNLYVNQQRFVNHYDMHLFYKELLFNLYIGDDGSNDDKLYQDMIYQSLPRNDDGIVLSQSILEKQISVNRECVGISNGYCFCDVLQSKPINDELLKNDEIYLKTVINEINKITGNGSWHCNQLNIRDFTISLHLENTDKSQIHISIEKIMTNKTARKQLVENNGLLSFSANLERRDGKFDEKYHIPYSRRDGRFLPSIRRIDYFKYEECLTEEYENKWYKNYDKYFKHKHPAGGSIQPVFKNKSMTINMLTTANSNKVIAVPTWNLRLCNCKLL